MSPFHWPSQLGNALVAAPVVTCQRSAGSLGGRFAARRASATDPRRAGVRVARSTARCRRWPQVAGTGNQQLRCGRTRPQAPTRDGTKRNHTERNGTKNEAVSRRRRETAALRHAASAARPGALPRRHTTGPGRTGPDRAGPDRTGPGTGQPRSLRGWRTKSPAPSNAAQYSTAEQRNSPTALRVSSASTRGIAASRHRGARAERSLYRRPPNGIYIAQRIQSKAPATVPASPLPVSGPRGPRHHPLSDPDAPIPGRVPVLVLVLVLVLFPRRAPPPRARCGLRD